jgi:hypothetical protein
MAASGPSDQVLLALRVKGQEKGQALLSALQQACNLLQPRSPFTPDLHKQVKDRLQALHVAVVDLDVGLESLDTPVGEDTKGWAAEQHFWHACARHKQLHTHTCHVTSAVLEHVECGTSWHVGVHPLWHIHST